MTIPKNNIDTLIKFLFYLFPILTVLRMMRGLGWLYYGTQAILLLFIILFVFKILSEKKSLQNVFDKRYLILFAFPLWATLTALWSINPVSTALKGLNFVFVVTAIICGILLLNFQSEKNILKYILPANVLVIITSFFSLIFHFPADAWTIGHGLGFAGFFTHQNVLAMAALFTLPGAFALRAPINRDFHFVPTESRAVSVEGIAHSTDRNNSHKWSLGHSIAGNKKNTFFFLLLLLNLLIVILSYSRAVMLALIVFGLLWLILNRKKKNFIIAGLLIVILFSLTFIDKNFRNQIFYLLNKHNYSILESRTMLWEPSLKAAKIGGITGVGYGMNAPGIYVLRAESLKSKYVNFYREKGNLALALVEETGIIGLSLFLASVIFILWRLYKQKGNAVMQLLFITIIALVVHSNFEGWSGGGNPQMQLFFFLLATSVIINNKLIINI